MEVTGNFIQWKYARLGLKHYLIGLKEREINVLGLDFLPVAAIGGTKLKQIDKLLHSIIS